MSLLYRSTRSHKNSFSHIHDARKTATSTNPATQRLAELCEIRGAPCHRAGALRHCLARAWAADSINARVRLAAENDRLHEECALLREELRLKDHRIAQIPPQRRPHYGPHERMAILELRAARGWSLKQTADTFFLTPATIASWMKRVDEQGPEALLQLREPVNKYPDFVRYIVQRLKTLSPSMGKVKIAETLCRAGLHLGVTTVGRILKEDPHDDPVEPASSTRVVTAKRPNHVWHVDLTAVPIYAGFWASWLPFSLPQCWPFCWWVAVVIDHYSRRMMGMQHSSTTPRPLRFSTSSNVPSMTPVPRPNTSSATRASSSGATCSRIGVIAEESHHASAPLANTAVSPLSSGSS